MKIIYRFLFFALAFMSLASQAQTEFQFSPALQGEAIGKLTGDIKAGEQIQVTGLVKNTPADGYPEVLIKVKNASGVDFLIPEKKLADIQLAKTSTVSEIWNKYIFSSKVYSSFLLNSYQHERRNNLAQDASQYVHYLTINDRFYDDPAFENYLYQLINKIRFENGEDQRAKFYSVKILKEATPNAMMLVNGCIIITTGLIASLQSEDELVGVLAHEMAHHVLDHSVTNVNELIEKERRANNWAAFATVLAASADVFLASKNPNYIPGALTATTAVASSVFAKEYIEQLGLDYNYDQERTADKVATEILEAAGYNKLGLASGLNRIKQYLIMTSQFENLGASGTHPSLASRIGSLLNENKLPELSSTSFTQRTSLITSHNAWSELWYFNHYATALELVNRNIASNVAMERDYLVKATIISRTSDTDTSNKEALALIQKAKSIQVEPLTILEREEGLIYLRLGNKEAAINSLNRYIERLNEIKGYDDFVESETLWARRMIFKTKAGK